MVSIEPGFKFACKVFVKILVKRKLLAICKYGIVMLYFVDGCTQEISDEDEECMPDVKHHIVNHMYFVVIL
jgi:hypothetical protein